MNFFDAFNNGVMYINGKEVKSVANISWDKHTVFQGVFTKNIFSGNDCSGFNAMMVRIDPGYEIGMHIHEGKTELHEIIDGDGEAVVNNTTVKYYPGIISLISADIQHSIKAGSKGLFLLAKFAPPSN
jgi:mannose-6-phosphate isomerase-like protein (cupin superfamily)